MQSAWNKYRYFDESDYVLDIDYEREFNTPLAGVSKSLADVRLDNTSGRFSPHYIGGQFGAVHSGRARQTRDHKRRF